VLAGVIPKLAPSRYVRQIGSVFPPHKAAATIRGVIRRPRLAPAITVVTGGDAR